MELSNPAPDFRVKASSLQMAMFTDRPDLWPPKVKRIKKVKATPGQVSMFTEERNNEVNQ